MSEGAAAAGGLGTRSDATVTAWAAPDARRRLQLGLAAIWLLDGVLQFQSFMFSRGFPRMLAGTASGNPGLIADPITWTARIIQHHPVGTNALFAAIQLLLGLGIAWRPTLKAALAASIVWAAGVWWFGEGLGGVLSGVASPANGAPGAVIIYALLAVLLWPRSSGGDPAAPFVAARAVGVTAARALWLVLWGSLAYFALTPANRAPQGLHDMITAMATGEPGWLAAVNRAAAGLLAHQGLTASVVLAVVLAVIAAGIYLPARAAKVLLVLAAVVALVIWIAAEDLGTILARGGTDVNSGPLLLLLTLAYWPSQAAASPHRPAGQHLAAKGVRT